MRTDFFLTIVIATVLLAGMCWPSEAVARGCSSCQAATSQAEAPVQYVAPAVSVCLAQRVEGQPVRNVGRVVVTAPGRSVAWFQERRPVRRAVTAPLRWLKGCGG